MVESHSKAFLSLDRINKSYGDVRAVQDLSVDINAGELVTFIGPSGCGKTTLLRAIGGFAPQDFGDIRLDGEVINDLPPESRPTGMVFQNYALFPHMSVQRNVAYGLKRLGLSKQEQQERVREAISQVRLEGYEDRDPSQLSGGQQQRVAIARCLVRRPKLLLLDEPLSNLDANLRVIMRDEIRRIKDELGITVLFVTHDQEEALSISDRVLVLNDGLRQQYGTPHTVYNYPSNEFVSDFLGTSNKVRGKVRQNGDGMFFDSDGFSFPVRSLHRGGGPEDTTVAEPDGRTHTVLIRPEGLRFDDSSSIRAKVVDSVYHGNFTRYLFDVGELRLTAEISNGPGWMPHLAGETVGVTFPEDLFVLSVQD